jgi:DNA-directed RNA polymerase specialized sigma24 family protein
MATVSTEIFFIPRETRSPTSRKQFDKLDEWFSRCHNTLHFMARLILGGSDMAERAVRNCRFRASRSRLSFESEGPFRSWLLRLLISEALSILQRSHTEAPGRKRL